jgi:hypothetical protein
MKPRHHILTQDQNEIQVSVKRVNGDSLYVAIIPPEGGCGEKWGDIFQLQGNSTLVITIPVTWSDSDGQTDDEVIAEFETQMREGAKGNGIEN